ncbi:MAG: hypothetical protein ABIJ34_05740 [archaeon]
MAKQNDPTGLVSTTAAQEAHENLSKELEHGLESFKKGRGEILQACNDLSAGAGYVAKAVSESFGGIEGPMGEMLRALYRDQLSVSDAALGEEGKIRFRNAARNLLHDFDYGQSGPAIVGIGMLSQQAAMDGLWATLNYSFAASVQTGHMDLEMMTLPPRINLGLAAIYHHLNEGQRILGLPAFNPNIIGLFDGVNDSAVLSMENNQVIVPAKYAWLGSSTRDVLRNSARILSRASMLPSGWRKALANAAPSDGQIVLSSADELLGRNIEEVDIHQDFDFYFNITRPIFEGKDNLYRILAAPLAVGYQMTQNIAEAMIAHAIASIYGIEFSAVAAKASEIKAKEIAMQLEKAIQAIDGADASALYAHLPSEIAAIVDNSPDAMNLARSLRKTKLEATKRNVTDFGNRQGALSDVLKELDQTQVANYERLGLAYNQLVTSQMLYGARLTSCLLTMRTYHAVNGASMIIAHQDQTMNMMQKIEHKLLQAENARVQKVEDLQANYAEHAGEKP